MKTVALLLATAAAIVAPVGDAAQSAKPDQVAALVALFETYATNTGGFADAARRISTTLADPKQFRRTWATATVSWTNGGGADDERRRSLVAATALAVLGKGRPASATARKRAIGVAVKDVARYLGNTPTVCRNSYIDPRVFDRFHAGVTIGGIVDRLGEPANDDALRRALDTAVLELLQGDLDGDAIERLAA